LEELPLLRAEGGEKESQFGLVKPEDGRPTDAETMILRLTPDEALVVDVARGVDSGKSERTASSCRRPTVSARTGRNAMLRAL